jgi:hypothetical protein
LQAEQETAYLEHADDVDLHAALLMSLQDPDEPDEVEIEDVESSDEENDEQAQEEKKDHMEEEQQIIPPPQINEWHVPDSLKPPPIIHHGDISSRAMHLPANAPDPSPLQLLQLFLTPALIES